MYCGLVFTPSCEYNDYPTCKYMSFVPLRFYRYVKCLSTRKPFSRSFSPYLIKVHGQPMAIIFCNHWTREVDTSFNTVLLMLACFLNIFLTVSWNMAQIFKKVLIV